MSNDSNYYKKYREANKEKLAEYGKKWYQKNKDNPKFKEWKLRNKNAETSKDW